MHESSTAATRHAQLAGKRILVIEDDWFIAYALSGLLRAQGSEVVGPAATVQEAAELAGSKTVDLAVVDLNLGGDRADPVVEQLATNGVPVVVVSAYETHAMVGKVYATLEKPVAAQQLVEALASAADGSGPPTAA
jgi:DNA-binding NarL/FixJ family response regulator